MKEYLILDGYNVINSWPELERLMSQSLEVARTELIGRMAEYRAYRGINVIIVFDAYLVKGSNRSNEKLQGVEIVFTKEKETADAYIERLITQLSSNRNRVSVVPRQALRPGPRSDIGWTKCGRPARRGEGSCQRGRLHDTSSRLPEPAPRLSQR